MTEQHMQRCSTSLVTKEMQIKITVRYYFTPTKMTTITRPNYACQKMWYIYTMEYYSAIKKNEIMPLAATWMDLEIVLLSEVSQRKRNIILYPLYAESKKK